MTPLLVALTVIVSPVVPPDAEKAGVESDVRLSVDDVPRSEGVRRSGAAGAVGTVVSIVIDNAVLAVDTFPA